MSLVWVRKRTLAKFWKDIFLASNLMKLFF